MKSRSYIQSTSGKVSDKHTLLLLPLLIRHGECVLTPCTHQQRVAAVVVVMVVVVVVVLVVVRGSCYMCVC